MPKMLVITRKAYGGRVLRDELEASADGCESGVADGGDCGDGAGGRGEHRVQARAGAYGAAAEAMMAAGKAVEEEQKMAVLAEARAARVHEFREQFANPYVAAERGYMDAVILPQRDAAATELRRWRCWTAKRDKNPPKKHGNIPL